MLSACGPTVETGVTPGIGNNIKATGNGPVDSVITLDAHAFVGHPDLAAAYRDAATRAAAATIDQGGHLRVTAFGAIADRAELVLDTVVPPLDELDELQRVEAEDSARADLAVGLDAVLGLSDVAPEVTARVRENAGGADVARAVRAAVRAVRPVVRGSARDVRQNERANPAAVVVISPGLNDTAELVVKERLGTTAPSKIARELRRLTGPADTVDVLQFLGIGQTGIGKGLDGADTDRLVVAWRAACLATRASSCPVRSSL